MKKTGSEPPAVKELVLVPVGAKEPKVVQRKWPIGDVVYTNSLRAFNDPRR